MLLCHRFARRRPTGCPRPLVCRTILDHTQSRSSEVSVAERLPWCASKKRGAKLARTFDPWDGLAKSWGNAMNRTAGWERGRDCQAKQDEKNNRTGTALDDPYLVKSPVLPARARAGKSKHFPVCTQTSRKQTEAVVVQAEKIMCPTIH